MNNRKTGKSCLMITGLYSALLSTNVLSKDIKISGEIMLDHDSFDAGFMEDSESSQKLSEIRRARLGFKTDLMDDWKAKLKIDFSDDNAEIKDAYIKYKGWEWADITIGKQKEGFGLERLTSSSNTLMIERSLVTSALAPGRSLGINLSGDEDIFNWQLGYFQPEENENTSAITGRVAWLPWREENKLLHIGVAFSERDLDGTEYRINEKMEVHTADSLIEGNNILANKESLQGIELLWQHSGITALAEWQQSTVTDTSNAEYDYQGGFLQVSYQLSGANRQYKKGVLGSANSSGWELTSRYSQFELIEEAHEVEAYSIGLNYTVNKNLKFMANYINAEQFYDDKELTDNAIALRVQYTF
jgi:phosphate-selective porin OprO/OprP